MLVNIMLFVHSVTFTSIGITWLQHIRQSHSFGATFLEQFIYVFLFVCFFAHQIHFTVTYTALTAVRVHTHALTSVETSARNTTMLV